MKIQKLLSVLKSKLKKQKEHVLIVLVVLILVFKPLSPDLEKFSSYSSKVETTKSSLEVDESVVSSTKNLNCNSSEKYEDSNSPECEKFMNHTIKKFRASEKSRSLLDTSEKRLIELIELGQNPSTRKFDSQSIKEAQRVIKLELKGKVVNLRRATQEQRKNKIVFLAEDRKSGKLLYFDKKLNLVDEVNLLDENYEILE